MEVAAGVWFLSAFVLMYFTESHPRLRGVVWWTFAIYVGACVVFAVVLVALSVASGASRVTRLYHRVVDETHVGPVGKTLLAIWFVIAFLVAVVLARF